MGLPSALGPKPQSGYWLRSSLTVALPGQYSILTLAVMPQTASTVCPTFSRGRLLCGWSDDSGLLLAKAAALGYTAIEIANTPFHYLPCSFGGCQSHFLSAGFDRGPNVMACPPATCPSANVE